MKTIVLHGSPHKDGNSDTLAKQFLKGLYQDDSSQVQHFYTNELNVRPCQGCLTCETSVDHICAIADDMQVIRQAFESTDIVVWATPMYWGYMTAQLKAVLDRMESFVMADLFDGKTFVVLITYRHHYQSTVAFFERICPFFNVKLHVITCCTMDPKTQQDIPISMCQTQLNEAYALGQSLAD